MADWYRNTEWNKEIEEFFFEKLGRARSQRDQYIVLQALTLCEIHPEVTLRLVDYYFETRTDNFDDGRARMAASRAHFALSGYEAALDEYAKSIGHKDADQVLHVGSPIQFAFLAARHRSQKHYLIALDLLQDLEMPQASEGELYFMYCTAYALILHESGRDPAGAEALATKALETPHASVDQMSDLVWRLRGITRQ